MPEGTPIKLNEVKSSNVAAVGFADGQLVVKYKNNRTYSYYGVPEQVFSDILSSEEAGKAIAEKVKGQYPTKPKENCDEVEDTTPPVDNSELENADAADEGEVSDESATDTPEAKDAEPEAEAGTMGANPEGDAGEVSKQDGGQGASDAEPETADSPASEQGGSPDYSAEEVTLGVDGDDETINQIKAVILAHFGADELEQVGITPENVIEFSVLKNDEAVSDVPVEIKTGTLLSLLDEAREKVADELDQTPSEAQSVNLNIVRDELEKFSIDLQYERVEDKTGARFWNLKASVEREDRTLSFSTRIVENCTKDEAEAAAEEIVANFVTAG